MDPCRILPSDAVLLTAQMPVTGLISSECPPRVLETDSPRVACCELLKERADAEESRENTQQNGLRPPQAEHLWLDPQLVERLPVHIRRGECIN